MTARPVVVLASLVLTLIALATLVAQGLLTDRLSSLVIAGGGVAMAVFSRPLADAISSSGHQHGRKHWQAVRPLTMVLVGVGLVVCVVLTNVL